jgi:hypothetical protein
VISLAAPIVSIPCVDVVFFVYIIIVIDIFQLEMKLYRN